MSTFKPQPSAPPDCYAHHIHHDGKFETREVIEARMRRLYGARFVRADHGTKCWKIWIRREERGE